MFPPYFVLVGFGTSFTLVRQLQNKSKRKLKELPNKSKRNYVFILSSSIVPETKMMAMSSGFLQTWQISFRVMRITIFWPGASKVYQYCFNLVHSACSNYAHWQGKVMGGNNAVGSRQVNEPVKWRKKLKPYCTARLWILVKYFLELMAMLCSMAVSDT